MTKTVLLTVGLVAASLVAVALGVWGISAVAFKGDPAAGIEAAAGVISLVVALLTFRALKVAQVSADAAEKAADAALKGAITTQNIERAYLVHRVPDVDWRQGTAVLEAVNLGKTPAVVRRHIATVLRDAPAEWPTMKDVLTASEKWERVFGAAEVGKIGTLSGALTGFIVVSAIEYDDIFGHTHYDGLAARFRPGRPNVERGFETIFEPLARLSVGDA